MLRMIAKLLKVLNSEAEPGQISVAFCLAMIMGLTPMISIHNLLVLLIVLLVRVNLLDPLFNWIGITVLTVRALEAFWTALYNITLFRLEQFNNSIVTGSLLFSLVFFIPLYLLSNLAIRRYRAHVLAWVQKTRIIQALKASKLYAAYQTVSGWGGAS
jgi:hypothetical protein